MRYRLAASVVVWFQEPVNVAAPEEKVELAALSKRTCGTAACSGTAAMAHAWFVPVAVHDMVVFTKPVLALPAPASFGAACTTLYALVWLAPGVRVTLLLKATASTT